MNNAAGLLLAFQKKGIHLWTQDGQLRYRAPKGSLHLEDIAKLRSMKDEFIRLLAVSDSPNTRIVLSKQTFGDLAPVTFQQRWLLNMIQRESKWHFCIAMAFRISGPLNIDALRTSIHLVCNRHEALRTRIIDINGSKMQQIDSVYEHYMELISLDSESVATIAQKTQLIVEDFLRARLDLAVGPLFKTLLVKTDGYEHVFALTVHHLFFDAASIQILLDEIWTFYADIEKGNPPSTPKPPIQYGDYAFWQGQMQLLWDRKHIEYWQNRLSSAVRFCIPIHDASLRQDKTHTTFQIRLPSFELRNCAQRSRTTATRLVLTAFVSLLSRVFHVDDVVVPFNSIGRDSQLLNQTIGYFSRLTYLRIQLGEEDAFGDVLQHVNDEIDAAFKYDDLGQMTTLYPDFIRGLWFSWEPWKRRMSNRREVNSQSTPSHGCSSAIKLTDFPLQATISGEDSENSPELAIVCEETADAVIINGISRAHFFDSHSMDRFGKDFTLFLQMLIKDPNIRIKSAPVMNE